MIRHFFSFIFVWLLVFSTLGIVFYQIQRPGELSQQARATGLYETVTDQAGTILASGNQGSFTIAEATALVRQSWSADSFYQDFDTVSRAYLDYLTSRSDSLAYQVDFSQIKTNLVVNAVANTQLRHQVSLTVASLPDQLTPPPPSPGLIQTRNVVTGFLHYLHYLWLLTAAFLVLYLVIFRRRAFLPLAWIFLLAGLLELGFGLIGWGLLKTLLTNALNHSSLSFGPTAGLIVQLLGAVMEILKIILKKISYLMFAISAVLLVLGLISHFRYPLRQ
jgi:hypothetical protein